MKFHSATVDNMSGSDNRNEEKTQYITKDFVISDKH